MQRFRSKWASLWGGHSGPQPSFRRLVASREGRLKNGVGLATRFAIIILAAIAAIAQTVSEKPTADVRRVGARLQCQCGCKDSVSTCNMLECSFSKPAKERIAKMQAAGYNDAQIVDAFIRDNGQKIYLAPPSAFGWVVPYLFVLFGLLVIWSFLNRYRKPRVLTELGPMEIDDPALEKYKAQIEEDLKKIE